MADVQIAVIDQQSTQIAVIDQQNIQIAVIDQQNTQIALAAPAETQLTVAAPAETQVTVAVPGIQGPVGLTGNVAVALDGTASLPGIRFENDTDTGIYRPGTNQLAFATNGIGRLTIDASGNTFSSNVSIPLGSATAASGCLSMRVGMFA